MRRAYLETLLSYVPATVDRLRRRVPRRSASFAEEIEATVLVADLTGFTRLSERLGASGPAGAEELMGLLNRTFRMLIDDIALARGGDLIAFGGDGFTLLFLDEGHARVALAAALEIQEAMALFPVAETSLGEVPLALRVGVATGRVFFAVVSPPGSAEVVIGGAPVRGALDLQRACPVGSVLADSESVHRAGEGVVARPLGAAGQVVEAIDERPPRVPREAVPIPEGEENRRRMARQLEPFVPARVLPRIRRSPEAPRQVPSFVDGTALFMRVEGIPLEGGSAVLPALSRLLEAVAILLEPLGEPLRKIDVDRAGFKLILVYGPPDGSETHARDAALTAALIRKGLMPPAPVQGEGVGPRVYFGLASGSLWSGEVGSRRRREYTAMGDPMNLAARLAGRAEPWEILATEAVGAAARDLIPSQEVGPLKIRGHQTEVPVVRLL